MWFGDVVRPKELKSSRSEADNYAYILDAGSYSVQIAISGILREECWV